MYYVAVKSINSLIIVIKSEINLFGAGGGGSEKKIEQRKSHKNHTLQFFMFNHAMIFQNKSSVKSRLDSTHFFPRGRRESAQDPWKKCFLGPK